MVAVEPNQHSVVRMPCLANDRQVRAIHDEIAVVAGKPTITVVSAFGKVETTDLERLLTVPRWGRISLISFKTADLAVMLENNAGRCAIIEGSKTDEATGARLREMVRDCRKWWMVPCFGWAVLVVLGLALVTWGELGRARGVGEASRGSQGQVWREGTAGLIDEAGQDRRT